MAQYLMALLGGREPGGGFMTGMSQGRMGDYVFNQEGLHGHFLFRYYSIHLRKN
jgi:hypothetical protein